MGRSNRSTSTLAPAAFGALSTILALAACMPSGVPSAPSIPADATQRLVSPVVSSSEPTPDRTPVPGFEDWEAINAQAVRISKDDDALTLELIGSVRWFASERGVLFHTEVTGDFRATATVRTSKSSDPDAPPGGDGTVQLAGLMARTEVPAENYVFIVTGSLGASVGIESKTTTSSHSIFVQRAVGRDGDADLRLCREGETFRLAFRPAGSTDPWQPYATFDRPDLPATLQVGANIYTDDVPDITARFEDLTIEPLATGEAC